MHVLTNKELSQGPQEAWELLFEYTDPLAQQFVVVVHTYKQLRQIYSNLR